MERSLKILDREQTGSRELETWHKVWEELEQVLSDLLESGTENRFTHWVEKVSSALENFLQTWDLEDPKDQYQFLMSASNALLFASNDFETLPEIILPSCKRLVALLQARLTQEQERLEHATTLDLQTTAQSLIADKPNEVRTTSTLRPYGTLQRSIGAGCFFSYWLEDGEMVTGLIYSHSKWRSRVAIQFRSVSMALETS